MDGKIATENAIDILLKNTHYWWHSHSWKCWQSLTKKYPLLGKIMAENATNVSLKNTALVAKSQLEITQMSP